MVKTRNETFHAIVKNPKLVTATNFGKYIPRNLVTFLDEDVPHRFLFFLFKKDGRSQTVHRFLGQVAAELQVSSARYLAL